MTGREATWPRGPACPAGHKAVDGAPARTQIRPAPAITPKGDVKVGASSSGFTLVELLVVLAILGLLTLLVVGVLRFGVRAWESGVEQVAQDQEVEVAQSLLRRLIGQARLLPDRERAGSPSEFLGGREYLRFVTPLPPRLILGGFYVVSLELTPSKDDEELLIGWHIYRPDDDSKSSGSPTRDEKHTTLLDQVESLSLEYFGRSAMNEDPTWTDSWNRVDALPQLVRVGVEFGDGDSRSWPDLVVAVMAAERAL